MKVSDATINSISINSEQEVEQLLTVPEVAPRVRMSEQALYAAIRNKQFPAVTIGRRIRIPASALRRFIAE